MPTAAALFARKPVAELVEETEEGNRLRRAVGTLDLTALGVGAIIGTGIFVIIGEAMVIYAAYGRSHSRLQREPQRVAR